MYEFVPVLQEHIDELARTMREDDAKEVWYAAQKIPHAAIQTSAAVSRDTTTWLVNGAVGCIFGVRRVNALSDTGVPWMLGSDLVVEHYRKFARDSIKCRDAMQEEFDALANYVYIGNKFALRWLAWLGFEIEPAEQYGPGRKLFHRFVWER